MSSGEWLKNRVPGIARCATSSIGKEAGTVHRFTSPPQRRSSTRELLTETPGPYGIDEAKFGLASADVRCFPPFDCEESCIKRVGFRYSQNSSLRFPRQKTQPPGWTFSILASRHARMGCDSCIRLKTTWTIGLRYVQRSTDHPKNSTTVALSSFSWWV